MVAIRQPPAPTRCPATALKKGRGGCLVAFFLGSYDMEWFKHDSNANLDDKLQLVLMDYGLEGYGLYWYCLELIVGRVSAENITFELRHDARVIARNTGSTIQKVEEMMRRFVELGLFEDNNGTITCLKVAKRLMSSATSNPKMREMLQNINRNQQIVVSSCQRHDGVMQDKIRTDEIRTEKKKHTREIALVTDYGFDVFWDNYPKKVGKDAARKSWNKVKPPLDQIMQALTWQIQSEQWKKGFIPNPTTYLNQGRWQDEPPVVDMNPF